MRNALAKDGKTTNLCLLMLFNKDITRKDVVKYP